MTKANKTTVAPKFPAAGDNGKTWVVVADGGKVRIFKRDEDGRLDLLDQIISTRERHLKHKPSHIEAPHADDIAFIREVGDWLHNHSESGSFNKFVLVAPPKMLPHYKKAFSDPLHERLMHEIDKDLAHLEDSDVCRELCDIMWF